VPEGIDEAAVRRALLDRYGLEIGAGLGALAGKIWRVGLMGQSATAEHVMIFSAALEEILVGMGAKIKAGAALPAARQALAAG
jgi:alanine-glyoxylate transaminase/serine-glyoxylate transaminase/serine-pyruvate transaminase